LVMDCAGWHKSKNLQIPENILIVYLPPYSPELNPVEKFWQYIKSRLIKNRIYKSLATLENAVSDFITNLDSKTIKITCSINHALS
jgi:transposase